MTTYFIMIIFQYYFKAFKQFSDFKTRSTRSEYWLFIVVKTIIYILFVLLPMIYILARCFFEFHLNSTLDISISKIVGSLRYNYFMNFFIFYTIFWLVNFIPFLAVSVRRLHDIGKSGWWILLFLLSHAQCLLRFIFLVKIAKQETTNMVLILKEFMHQNHKNTYYDGKICIDRGLQLLIIYIINTFVLLFNFVQYLFPVVNIHCV